MKYTTNYNLNKPDYTDGADIPAHYNLNMDIIDAKIAHMEKPDYLEVTSQSDVITLENSVKGQVSVELFGRSLKQELNYNKDTWTEWTFNHATADSTGVTLDLDVTGNANMQLLNQNLKPSTKYGVIFNIISNTMTGNNMYGYLGQKVFPDNGIAINNTSLGNQKFIVTTHTTIDEINNKFALSSNFVGGSGKVKVAYIRVFELLAGSQIETDFNTLPADELAQKYPYIKGDSTKSTVLAIRKKSVGKNLFDKSKAISGYYINYTTGVLMADINYTSSDYIKIKSNTQYYKNNVRTYALYDANKNFISGGTVTNTFTTPSNAAYVRFTIKHTEDNIDTTQLEEGITATAYEEYKESISYVYAVDENGNLIEGHSLPNDVKDEFNSVSGKLTKNINQVILNGSENWVYSATGTNTYRFVINGWSTDNGAKIGILEGHFITYNNDMPYKENYHAGDDERLVAIHSSDNNLYIRVEKSKIDSQIGASLTEKLSNYLTTYPITLIYQLETEKVYEIEGWESLQSFDGVTYIIREPVIRFEEIANQNGEISIPYPEYPIDFVEKVQEKILDPEGVRYIDVSYSQVDNTKISGLTYGKKYRVIYHYPRELTTNGELTAKYSVNIAATMEGVLEVQRQLTKELGSVWITLLPLADKELGMYMITEIATPATVTAEQLANKVNEILQIWKG